MIFNEAKIRDNISSGEKLSVILGKIKKCISDIKDVAFSGSYNDLSDTPNSLKNPNSLNIKFNGTTQANYDGSTQKEVNITPDGISAVNTSALLNTTEQISANTNANNFTGALAAKEMMADYNNKINTINSNLADKFRQGTISESGTTDLFRVPWQGAALLIGWVVANGASTPTVCIAASSADNQYPSVIQEINAGTSVYFQIAEEDGQTIQFVNPYGNVCFWNAILII